MRQREIIKALLAKQIPERMGLNEDFWPFLYENTWSAQGMPANCDWVKHFKLDIRGVQWFGVPEPRPDLVKTIEETDEWIVNRNGWGGSYKNWKKKAGTPEHVDFMLTSPEAWKKDFRDAALAIDIRKTTPVADIKKALETHKQGDEFIVYKGAFVFEEMRKVMGDMAMLESFALEPEFIHDFCRVITRKNLEYYDLILRECGVPDGAYIYEDLGYTRAPFVSPQMHREFVMPYHKQLFDLFKSYGLPVIMHSCGDFRKHLPAIVESGVDCVQALEAKTGMNVVELAREWKDKLCFMGNLDVRAFETPTGAAGADRARLKDEILTKVNGMKKLRAPYIFMSDHSISPSVKLADYLYAQELFWQNCRY